MDKVTTVTDYISGFPKPVQKLLEQLRSAVKKAAPGAEEMISYGIPAYKLNKKILIYFAAHGKHIGLYPAPRGNEAFEELSAYKGGKGTIQFPLDKPLPLDLIARIVK